MPMDGLTLGFIARELNTSLAGARVEKITQPEKDMLLLTLRNNSKNYKLILSASPSFPRVHLTSQQFVNPIDAPMFLMLMRKHLSGGRLMSITQLHGDRVLLLSFEAQDELGEMHPYQMYFEAMGRHSNLTLVRDGRIIDAIRHVTDDMSRVRQALPGLAFIEPPLQDKLSGDEITPEAILTRLSVEQGPLRKVLSGIFSGLSGIAAAELSYRMTGLEQALVQEQDLPALAERLNDHWHRLDEMASPRLLLDESGMPADVFPHLYLTFDPDKQKVCESLSAAFDVYFTGRDRRDRILQRSVSLRRLIKTHIERCEKKLALQEEELLGASHAEEWRVMGELLTSQLHLVPRGAATAILPNYYTGEDIEIPLEVRFTPAQNAQRYFKRYQKARAAARLAAEQKEKTLRDLAVLEEAMCDLDRSENEFDLGDIRRVLTDAGFIKKTAAAKKAPKDNRQSAVMRFKAQDGMMISVGKNAMQNERLTMGAQPNDVWLHAKDMPGSHVIIHTEGAAVSDETLLTAARLASWYSKGKGLSVPIDYTLRRYIKKPSGTPVGFVTFTHQKTLLITVSEAEINALSR